MAAPQDRQALPLESRQPDPGYLTGTATLQSLSTCSQAVPAKEERRYQQQATSRQPLGVDAGEILAYAQIRQYTLYERPRKLK